MSTQEKSVRQAPPVPAVSRSILTTLNQPPDQPDGSNESHTLAAALRDSPLSQQTSEWLRKFARVVQQTPAMVVITDTTGSIEYVNPAFERVTGYNLEEVYGQNPRILKSGLTPLQTYQEMWRMISSGEVWHGELCNRKKNGELYWDLGTVSSIRNTQGEITNFISVKEDITERKRTEAELLNYRDHLEQLVSERTQELVREIEERKRTEENLRENQQRLAAAQRIAQLGSWEWDAQTRQLYWSDETYRIFSISPQDFELSYEAALSRVHPDERDQVDQALKNALDTGQPVSFDHTILLPDGSQRIVNLNAAPANGSRSTRLVGTVQDVTERIRVKNELLEKERMSRELAIGRNIQRSILPLKAPHLKGWQFAAFYEAASQVGGDFYDFIRLSKGRLGMVIADVSDKGLPAALLMALSRAIVRATALHEGTPASTLSRVNRILYQDYHLEGFVTAGYALLDTASGRVEFANAGHNYPLLYSAASGQVEKVQARGTALGVLPRIRLNSLTVEMQPEDALVFYTDGLTEAVDKQYRDFGIARLAETLSGCASGSADEIVKAILQAWRDFVGDFPQSDDMTVFVVKRAGEDPKGLRDL